MFNAGTVFNAGLMFNAGTVFNAGLMFNMVVLNWIIMFNDIVFNTIAMFNTVHMFDIGRMFNIELPSVTGTSSDARRLCDVVEGGRMLVEGDGLPREPARVDAKHGGEEALDLRTRPRLAVDVLADVAAAELDAMLLGRLHEVALPYVAQIHRLVEALRESVGHRCSRHKMFNAKLNDSLAYVEQDILRIEQ
ncbi:hypothetical protein [Bifidobacterium choerinum]|nr:hypothetical protein [Bifidobacterium choerinum]